MLQQQLLALELGDGAGRVQRVVDLAAVEAAAVEDAHGVGDVGDAELVGGHGGEGLGPHPLADRGARGREAEGEVHARLHGPVEGLDAVGGQEDDAREVLELLEEDGHQRVALGVAGLLLAHLEEDVGLVEEHDGLPERGVLEEAAEVALEDEGPGAGRESGRLVCMEGGDMTWHDMA